MIIMDSDEWGGFLKYIKSLVLDGKSFEHPDFRWMIEIFGKEKIEKIRDQVLASEKCSSEKETNITQLRPATDSPPD